MLSSTHAPAGVLSVTVVEAKNLHKEDLFKNDPFVEIYFDEKYKQRTQEVKSSNEPTWNETFTFNITEGSSDHKLRIKVLDKDTIGSDKIGEGKLDVAEAYEGQIIDTWIKLPAKLGLTSHGEVHLVAQFQRQ
ncbi:C2 domain-containing protein [Absidia repens]|uniref:C2 domain-containing protein n=1 Tax=Absidia repens TaxID=90262 RepID=A0A1X2IVF9_9FUNG|nr:C2 domain-containing protein [Absidia repens]